MLSRPLLVTAQSYRFRIPLLEIFVPAVLGILWAKWLPRSSLGLLFTILGLSLFCSRVGLWKRLGIYGFWLSVLGIYAFWRFESAIAMEKDYIWGLTYAVAVEKIDLKKGQGKVYGYGKILRVYDEKYRSLEGHRLYFYLNGDRPYIPSQTLKMCSAIRVLRPDASETFYSYLVQKNIHLYGYRGKVREIVKPANGPWCFFTKIHHILDKRIKSYAKKYGKHPSDGILYGILLSEKKELSREQKACFHHTSAAHLLAVSGLHIGIIGFMLDFLLRCFFLGKRWRRPPIIGILLFYVGAIGFPPSAVRAWLMLSCFWSAEFFARRPSGISSLLLAALLTIFYNPILLFDIGFQLSYGIVAMLLLLVEPLTWGIERLYRHGKRHRRPTGLGKPGRWGRILRRGIELLSLSLASTLASTPLTFEYFNMFSLVGIFLNPIVMQMALLVVVCGFLFLLLGLLPMEFLLGDGLFLCARWGVRWLDSLLTLAEKYLPWHIEFLTKPRGMGIAIFTLCLGIALKVSARYKYRRWQRLQL
jgi:ComEC/Rec2-related protein